MVAAGSSLNSNQRGPESGEICARICRMTVRIAAGLPLVAVLLVLVGVLLSGTGAASSFLVVGIDTDVAGNTPRSVPDINDCSSMGSGDSREIDIFIDEPGIPADRGIVSFQLRFFYDPEILHVVSEDKDQLLDQASGSVLIPLSDPLPDRDGVYQTSAVDFGPSGVEPDGSSEKGPGVLTRIRIEAQQAGMTPMVVSAVQLKDDDLNDIEVDSVQPGRIYVGEPCPGFSVTATPTQAPTQGPTATPALNTATPAPTATPGTNTGTPAPSPAPSPMDGSSDPGVGGGAGGGSREPGQIVTAGGPPAAESKAGGMLLAALGAALAVAGGGATAGLLGRSDQAT